jgi:hypothetical protein
MAYKYKNILSPKLDYPLHDFFGNNLNSLGVPYNSKVAVDPSILPHGYIDFSQGIGSTLLGRFKPFMDLIFNEVINSNYLSIHSYNYSLLW